MSRHIDYTEQAIMKLADSNRCPGWHHSEVAAQAKRICDDPNMDCDACWRRTATASGVIGALVDKTAAELREADERN